MPILAVPGLRQPCPQCFPFGGPVFPHSTASTGATLRADYECPCGNEWSRWWSPSDPWPLASGRAA